MAEFKSLADFLGVTDVKAEPADKKPSLAELPQKLTVKAFCRGVLDSREYRESLYRRIILDELPAAVELELYNRAHGKLKEKVEVKDTTPIENLTIEQLEDRASALIDLARKLRGAEPSVPEADGVH